ncbi:MAG: glutathione S-transferase N-terminal domain-containing protein [Pseudomonadota bacterium]
MIDLYTWTTPNGRKVSIMLEEVGLPYRAHAIDITKGDQFGADFLKVSPNNKIPAMVDHDTGIALMESGAMLMYLAKKAGRLMSDDEATYWQTIQWLMWQMGGVGPMLGQVHHFTKYNPGKSPYAQDRYLTEGKRLYGVLDKQLAETEYLAGGYSIADIATWPWIARFDWQTINLNDYPNVKRWYLAIADRPAVKRGFDVPKNVQEIPMPD